MLSVSNPTVHPTIRPKTPESSPSPPSKGRKRGNDWNCEYRVFTKTQCRPSPARKKIIKSIGEDATIGIDVHCQTVRFDQTPLIVPLFVEAKSKDDFETSSLFTSKETSRPVCKVPFLKSAHMHERNKISQKLDENKIESFYVDENSQTEDERDNDIEEELFDGKPAKLENPSTDKKESSPVLSSRMSKALKFLQTKKKNACQNEEDFLNPGIPGIRGEDIPRNNEVTFPAVMEDNGWDSDAEISKLRDLQEPVSTIDTASKIDNDSFFVDPIDKNEPYYMVGLPNPPGENRCWLNATLHALFSVPLTDHIDQYERQQWRGVSHLTKTFMALKLFWTKGKKQNFYQTIKLFKESLGILDESYPSQRQQDVSEFLTMFLNYLKTDFEKFSTENNVAMRDGSEDMENITNNSQETREASRSPHTPSKRTPLADISPCKRKFHEVSSDASVESSPKTRKNNLTYTVRDLMSPRVNRLSNTTDPMYKVHTPPHNRDKASIKENDERINLCKNPIDRCFLLHMMEHYVCKGCAKHRQRKVDNLMIYIDLMHGSEDEIVSLDKSIKNTREPEERTLTCGKCKYGKHKVFTTFRFCPKILMVQINRYGMCSDGSVAKFNTPVEIPETLQLDLGMSDVENGNEATESFEPVCVIAHVGSAMDCGHYTSYVKHEDSWYHFNDLVVTPMSRHEALTAAQTTAYVVFFANTKV
ncbi:uncharacterized protein [Venturia canescens]|uniref:uncharacterized protein n=1 Tax=Venturia canescens TaxID=32260 RepID=UPI001C9CDD90|nr:uncharacterized protein LOC122408007 [Venturia canescens]